MGHLIIDGVVKHAKGRGARIGFPTINIDVPQIVKKADWGVYFSLITINRRVYPAITHLGPPKTFHLSRATCESYLLTFCGNLYGESVKKRLIFKLRDIQNFSGIKNLKKQIQKDIKAAKKFFGL